MLPINPAPRLLRAAWSPETAERRHIARATTLISEGVAIEKITPGDRPEVEALINSRIPTQELRMTENHGGAIARDTKGELLGALVVQAAQFSNGAAVHVRAIAVEQASEGRGIGTVLLGMAHQVINGVQLVHGGCAPETAAFYQRAGFTVLQPGAPMPFNLGNGAQVSSSNENFPCQFYRYL